MQDRTVKLLLTGIALLLAGLLLHSVLQPAAVHAQGIPVGTSASQMLVDKDNYSMYVMLNGKVYVYTREDDSKLRWVLWQILSPGQDVPQRSN